MERLGLIGVNWRSNDADILEKLTLPLEDREQELLRLQEETGVSEMLYLSTCNRVEVLFAADGETPLRKYRPRFFKALLKRQPKPDEAKRLFRAWGGEGAVEHLLLVAAGLDSAQLGEHEIRGQLKAAHEMSKRLGLSGKRLSFVVERAIRVAREVQKRTGLMDGRVSIAEVGLDAVRERLADKPGPVAVVGVSAMTERCAEELRREGVPLVLANRSPERARELAQRLSERAPARGGASGVVWRSLDDFKSSPDEVTAVITAVGAAEPILDRDCLERLGGNAAPPLLVDFGVPANVDSRAAVELGLPYLSMNAISRRAEKNQDRRRREAAQARHLVDEALVHVRRQMAERTLAPVLSQLGQRYRETTELGVARLFRKELKHLGADEREAVERFAQNIAKRLAHLPTVGLRALAAEHGIEAVDCFLSSADDILAQELKEAIHGSDGFKVDVLEDRE